MKKYLIILLVLIGLQTQAQQSTPYFCCDSITYWTDQSQGFNIGIDTSAIIHNPDSMTVLWQVCNSTMCYSGDGMYAYFGNVLITDTLKVCYDVMIWELGALEVCTRCDSLVFDQNTYTWLLYNSQGNPTGIEEEVRWYSDNTMYNLLGEEILKAPIGTIYIRNNKKQMRVK